MKKTIYIIGGICLLVACFNLNNISLYNLSDQYITTNFTELDAVAFNYDASSVKVFVPVNMADMASGINEANNRPYLKVKLKYELFQNYESKQILDSASFYLTDSSMRIRDTLFTLTINYPEKKKYILKIELTDLNRVDAIDTYLVLDNASTQSANNYLILDDDGEMLFWNVVREDEEISLKMGDQIKGPLFVRYYHREFPLALPPFLEEVETSFDYHADSVFQLSILDNETELIFYEKEGFYHFQSDTNQREGYTIFRFYSGFPGVSSTDQMIWPLRYITNKSEYNELIMAEDKKLALDNFWLANAGNPTRARAMIQKYYGRVEDANRFFTSYHEGWKTDRGLVYMVYGPPRLVYRGKNMEEWLYGEKGNKNSIRFQFVKVVNPFSENDYSLIKSPSFKENWYNIVNTWRR